MPTVFCIELKSNFDYYFPELSESAPDTLKEKLNEAGYVWYSEDGRILTIYHDITDVLPISIDTRFKFFNFSIHSDIPLAFGFKGKDYSFMNNYVQSIVDVLKKEGA